MAFIEYKGKQYEYDDDLSWNKWKSVLIHKLPLMENIDWYYNNVFIDKPDDWGTVLGLYSLLMDKLETSEEGLKNILRNAGKTARGIVVPSLTEKVVEANLLMNTGMTYSEIKELNFKDLLFFNMLISEKNRVR